MYLEFLDEKYLKRQIIAVGIDIIAKRKTPYSITTSIIQEPHNATLSGKKLLAKIVNGVKQPTVFCPFERLVRRKLIYYLFSKTSTELAVE